MKKKTPEKVINSLASDIIRGGGRLGIQKRKRMLRSVLAGRREHEPEPEPYHLRQKTY